MKFKIYIISILLTIVTSTTIFAQVPTIERDALIALYNSANGSNWDVNINWNTAEPVDTWSGVIVANGHVTELVLAAINLEGTIPTQIGDLTSLTTLIFTGNDLLTGNIPSTISNLVNLNDLVLESCQLTGNLPSLSTSVSNVYIDGNHFNFSNLENEFANYQTSTSIFNYAPQRKIDTEETIDIINGASYTMTMGLTSPNNRYQWLKNGIVIPGATQKDYTISNATAADVGDYHCVVVNDIVTGLTLERFPIHITVSADPCVVSQIERDALIALYNATGGANWNNSTNWNTNFSVCDWSGVTVVNGNVTELSLINNNLIGTIPSELGNLPSLTSLNLRSNQLTGSIPSNIGNLLNLDLLYLWGNQLTGSIPPELGNLTNLRFLHLSGNQLTGSIPSELGNLINLSTLSLNSNLLTGNIPIELGNLMNITSFSLGANQLIGSIPAEFGNLSNLKFLRLENNQLTGTLVSLPTNMTLINVVDNNLDFLDIENEFVNYQANVATFLYSPQSKIDIEETIDVTEGQPYTMSISLNSLNNNYQWFKNGVAIPNATQKDYVISNALIADAGDYHCTATNNIVTGLTLERFPIHLTVNGQNCLDVPQIEKDALIVLYNTTGGPNWTNNNNWNTAEKVCNWSGVTVVNGNVTELTLVNNNLVGTIPSELSNLSNLTLLNLDDNDLPGQIPPSLGNLSNLITLSIVSSNLSGSIPSQLGSLINLEILKLSLNNLTGIIPSELGNLTNLTDLRLWNNQLTGIIPIELGNLTDLTAIYLNYNQLTGNIPSTFGDLTKLRILYLHDNKLAGTIPSTLGNLTSLEFFVSQKNQLVGVIPQGLINISGILLIQLNNNLLNGSLPSFLTNQQGPNILIDDNKFHFTDLENEFSSYQENTPAFRYVPQGKIDADETIEITEGSPYTMSMGLTSTNNTYQWYKDGVAIAGATQKDYTIANAVTADAGDYYCTATNSIVTGLTLERFPIHITVGGNTGGVSQIERDALIALFNATDGPNWTNNTNWNTDTPVSDWYGITVFNNHVIEINLPGNNLQGAIPPEIGNLQFLTKLDLSYITEPLPPEIGNLLNLTHLIVKDGNGGSGRINGIIPHEIENLTNLTHLTLDGHLTPDTTPLNLSNLTKLVELILTDNKLSILPLGIENLQNLIHLDFSYNLLSGSIPIEITNLSQLKFLNLKTNQFSGTIPSEIGNLTSLESLILEYNQLSGIPSEISNLTNLKLLRLFNNQLTTIPPELGSLSSLSHLYIGRNQISNIPPELGNLSNLKHLHLNENQISNIPLELSSLNQLEWLDLSRNKLIGIQVVLTNIQNLQILDLNNNSITGNIPPEFSNLSNLWSLNLRTNKLTGTISEIADLPNLRTLNIQDNQFVGDLPPLLSYPTISNISIENNNFVFSNIEGEYSNYQTHTSDFIFDFFRYSPQNKFDTEETIDIAGGGTTTLTTSLTSTNNSYQWFKDGVEIVGATTKDYTISNASINDIGDYYVTATNSIVTGLTLERFPIHITVDGNSGGGVSLQERDALIAFYNATNGPNWINNTNWNTTEPVSTWNGVTVVDGKVTQLFFAGNNLDGVIPPEIGDLNNLTNLTLAFEQQLTGSIPVEIGNLENLKDLFLGFIGLTGTIPSELGNLQNLTNLQFLIGGLTGAIPAELGNLQNLKTLKISDGQLIGSIPPELGNLQNLIELNLSNNQLMGLIPPELNGLTQLTRLSLFGNKLTGNLPPLTLAVVQLLQINSNNFIFSDMENEFLNYQQLSSGPFTYSPQNNIDIEETVDIVGGGTATLTTSLSSPNNSYQWYKNGIAIDGATEKDYTISNATVADIGDYYVTATNSIVIGLTLERFPIHITINGSTCNVTEEEKNILIALYNATNGPNWTNNTNWLSGLPVCEWDRLGSFGSNRFLELNSNNLSGTIPPELGNLTSLTLLNLSNNDFSGSSIPPELGNLTNLTNLSLTQSQLSGTIPPELGLLSNLTGFNLSSNELTGSIPTQLTNLTNVNLFLLNSNKLTGSIPPEFNNLAGSLLILIQNQLSGTIPDLTNTTASLIYENNLKFIDFENQFVNNITNANFLYSPQNKIDNEETIAIDEGSLYSMTIGLTSPNNSYQWFKDSIAIPGATLKDYTINNATIADAGDYYATATNNIVTNLTLERFPIHLNVNEVIPCDTISELIITDRLINCIANPIKFSINTLPPGITENSYTWIFYDLDNTTVLGTSTLENPVFTYDTVGSYLVTLEIIHATGCIFTSDNTITVEDCVVPPEDCDTCNSFKPVLGKKYIISGWVKENREILCSPGTINSLTPTTDGGLEVNFTLEGIGSYVNLQQSFDQINWINNSGGNISPRVIPPLGNGLIYVRFNTDYCEEFSEVVTIDYQQPIATITGPLIAYVNNPAKFHLSVTGSNSPITNWSVDFGDGNIQNGVGTPPITLSHEYGIESVGKRVVVFNINNEAGFSAQGITLVKVIDEIPLGFDYFSGEITAEPGSIVYLQITVTGGDFNALLLSVIDSLDSSNVFSRNYLTGLYNNNFIMPASGKVLMTARFGVGGNDSGLATVKLSDSIEGLDTTLFQFTLNSINLDFPFN